MTGQVVFIKSEDRCFECEWEGLFDTEKECGLIIGYDEKYRCPWGHFLHIQHCETKCQGSTKERGVKKCEKCNFINLFPPLFLVE